MKHLAFWAALLPAAAALATTLQPLDVAGLTRASDVVVRGTVTGVSVRWTGDHARIMTDAEIQVAQVLKGAPGERVVVMQPGGEIGDVGQRVEGVARFAVGEEVVVFLEARGTRYLVAGMVQGKWRVERSSDGASAWATSDPEGTAAVLDPVTHQVTHQGPQALPLDELVRQVRAALPQAPPSVTPPAGTTPKATP